MYLVGGVVRDLALAGASDDGSVYDPAGNDIDLTTDARPADIKKLVSPLAEALWTQGERFGTIGATVAGQPLEITTHRAEAYDPDSRKPVVTFGDDLDEDLSRRDFTINAAAIEIPGPALHDPYNGLADLAAGVLRTPLSPEVSFTDDPLRMMRAARFIARFGLTPSPGLESAAADLADRLPIVSVERVSDELERLLALPGPGPGLAFLADTGLLGHIIRPYGTQPADDRTVAEHDRALAVSMASVDAAPVVRRAGLLWPIIDRAAAELRRLRYSKAEAGRTVRLLHAAAAQLDREPDAESVRRAVVTVGLDGIDHLVALLTVVAELDFAGGQSPVAGRLAAAEAFARHLTALRQSEDLSDLDGPMSGAEIMAVLGLEPGPIVGAATKVLREHRLINGPFGRAEAERVLLANFPTPR